jgi:hypothetical protein
MEPLLLLEKEGAEGLERKTFKQMTHTLKEEYYYYFCLVVDMDILRFTLRMKISKQPINYFFASDQGYESGRYEQKKGRCLAGF